MAIMRSKGCSFQPPNPQPFPWLMVFHGKSSKVTSFHSIAEKRDYVTKLPDFSNKIVCSHCEEGWLLLIDNHCHLHLFNLTSTVSIDLPPFITSEYYSPPLLPYTSTEKIKYTIRQNSCILTAPPSDPDCMVALFPNTLSRPSALVWRPGQLKWAEEQYASESAQMLRYVTVWNKKIFGVDESRYLCICEPQVISGGRLVLKRLALLPPNFGWPYSLVGGSCGNLFALQFLEWKPGSKRIQSIDVYRFDETNSTWILVQNIGDNVLFISCDGNSQAISCSATANSTANSGFKFKRSCIYFTRGRGRNLYTYDMEENRIHVSVVCPKAINNRSTSLFVMVQPYRSPPPLPLRRHGRESDSHNSSMPNSNQQSITFPPYYGIMIQPYTSPLQHQITFPLYYCPAIQITFPLYYGNHGY